MSDVTLIAELSSNHMGDMNLVRDMVVSAKENGADIVKFQTWSASKLKKGPWDNDGRREIYEKAELTPEKHAGVLSMCQDVGVDFLTTCFNPNDLSFIRTLTDKVKIASTECNNTELVEKAIEAFNTVYISTGASLSVEFEHLAKYENVYLLHCVAKYPCPAENVNIPRLHHIRRLTPRFGYSGHYVGIWDAVAAISIGAKVVEKHFTTDRNLPFKDNKFAIVPDELNQIRYYADEFTKMSIDHGIDFQECEQGARDVYARRWMKDNG